jgi:hypothetical protein
MVLDEGIVLEIKMTLPLREILILWYLYNCI